MRLRVRPALAAWTLCGLTALIATARLVLAIADPNAAGATADSRVPGGGIPLALVELTLLIAFAVIGAVVASRQPRNPVGWFLCTTPFLLGLGLLAERWYWHEALGGAGMSDSASLAIWLSTWTWLPAMLPMFTFVPLLFPSGRPPTRRWRKVGWAAGGALAVLFLALAFGAGSLDEHPDVANPVGLEFVDKDVLGAIGFPLLVFGAVGSAASLVVRFRRSRGIEREQLKWVATAAALLVVIWLAFNVFDDQVNDDTAWAIFLVGLIVLAGSVAIAMLRYRLYDIDVVINRTLVYAVLTATLAAVYLTCVLLMQLALGGFTSDNGLAVAGSTLAVAALFRPARSRIQAVVDRRFFRRRYDAARTLESFSASLRDQVELTTLDDELGAVVRNTLQPAHVSLWLREPEIPR